MATLANLVVRITGTTKDFEKSVDRANRKTKGFESSVSKLQKGLALAAGAAGAGLLAKRFFEIGVAAEETASKFRTTFGPATQEVSGFLNEFAVNAGLSITQGRELTATVGAIAQGIGFTERAAAGLSEQTVRLAADIASFNNTQGGTERVVRSLISAMNGETESLKEAANVAILQSDVMERAAEMTGKATSEITRQERALATLELVTERAGKAVGDLDRTQDSAANTIRRLRARALSLVEAWSSALLPALAAVITDVDEATEGFDEQTQAVFQNSVVIGRWAKLTVSGIKIVVQAHISLIRVVTNLAEQFVNLFELIGRGLAGQIDGVRAAWQKMQKDTADVGDALFDFVDAMGQFTIAAQQALDAPVPKLDLMRDGVDNVTDSVNTAAGAVRNLGAAIEALPDEIDIGGRSIEASRQRQVAMLRSVQQNLPQGNLHQGLGGRLGSLSGEIRIPKVERITVESGNLDLGAGKGGGLFDDIGGFLKGNLNVTEILSNTAANLLSGGVSTLIGAAIGGVKGLLSGESPAEAAARRAREENNAQLARLNQGIARLSDALLSERGADIQGARQALRGAVSGVGNVPFLERSDQLLDELRKVGLTFNDLQRIVEATGVKLDDLGSLSVKELQDALDALNSQILNQILNDFGNQFDLLQRRFELLDIEDPQAKIDAVVDLLGEKLPAKLFARLDGALASGNLDQFIADFFAQIDRGKFSLDQLGDLSFDEFLEALGFLESNLDSLSDSVNKATDAFRNVPTVFKTKGRIFDASDPVTLGAGGQGAQVVSVGEVHVHGVENPKEMWQAIQREARREKRQGGSGARLFDSAFTRPGVA